jgi:DNA-binding XRE family transcriptional regulator
MELPEYPNPLPNGNYPAVEYVRVSLARKFIRDRHAAGLTQAELAKRAGVRLQTIIRMESGRDMPSMASVKKVDRALEKVEAVSA